VLEDYPEDAPPAEGEITTLSCPVDFGQPDVELTETEKLCSAFIKEMTSLRPWYDLAVKKRGRTTVGVSKVDLDGLGDFDDISLHFTLNLATDDLKAYYFEAITAQPGQESPSSQVLSDWFYDETMAGKVLFALRDRANEGEDTMMKMLGNVLIIPAAQTEKRMKMAS
jgi:hypothetical protein